MQNFFTLVISLAKLSYDRIHSTQYLNGWIVELGGEHLFLSLDDNLFWYGEDHGRQLEVAASLAQIGKIVSADRPPAAVPGDPATQKLIAFKVVD